MTSVDRPLWPGFQTRARATVRQHREPDGILQTFDTFALECSVNNARREVLAFRRRAGKAGVEAVAINPCAEVVPPKVVEKYSLTRGFELLARTATLAKGAVRSTD